MVACGEMAQEERNVQILEEWSGVDGHKLFAILISFDFARNQDLITHNIHSLWASSGVPERRACH